MTQDMLDGDFDDTLKEALDLDFEEENQGFAEEELERLLLQADGAACQTQSSLLKKLELYPDGNFPISAYSMYGDSSWIIFKDKYGTPYRITFENISDDLIAIKKSIMYHLIPDFAPFAGLRAYSTTRTHAQNFRLIVKYVFADNHLSGDAESLSFITAKLLNDALNKAREASAFTHYHNLFMHIRFWMSLSTQKLIPEQCRIPVSATLVDTTERKKEVLQHFTGSLASWAPYTEADLRKLMEYVVFWTEKAMPCLGGVADYAERNHLHRWKNRTVTIYQENLELQGKLSATVDGIPIVTCVKNKRDYTTPIWNYTWYRSALRSLSSIRNALYILVALVSGLRASELSILEFSHVIEEANGRFKLQVTRFKTSGDPNYHGDTTFIPLPRFVGRKIKEYEKIRRSLGGYREGYLFQNLIGTKRLSRSRSVRLEHITSKLEKELDIDRVHTHRFRKTIAELLINRNERNIDIIRLLFGHANYEMTLRYIGRNPFLVQSVAHAIEKNYIEEFTEVISSVKTSGSTGDGAKRLVDKILARPDAFSGKQLKVTIFTYVTHLLSSGEPLFIFRTAVGTFCLSTQLYSSPTLPPCLSHYEGTITEALPQPQFCDPSCPHAVIVDKAATALKENMDFYEQMLTRASDTLSERSKKMLQEKVIENAKRLEELRNSRSYKLIPSVDVQA